MTAGPRVFDRMLRHRRMHRKTTQGMFLEDWAYRQIQDRLEDINRHFDARIDLTDQTHFDEEYLPFALQSLGLLTSVLRLHALNDLPGALIQIKRALKPDGLFLAALFGGETLYELRESLSYGEIKNRGGMSPRVFPFADKQQMGALMQRAGFALPVIDSEIVTVTYDNMFKLMTDLRDIGESNVIVARDKRNPGRAMFMEAAQH